MEANIPSEWMELAQIVNHDELCKSGFVDDVAGALLLGWDASPSLFRIDPPANGVWRAYHPVVLHNLSLAETALTPILSAGMNAEELEAGFWRQLRILPAHEPWRLAAIVDAVAKDPFTPPRRPDEAGTRSAVLRSLLGHTPRDAAAYLFNKLRTHPKVGRLLLAKDFEAALEEDAELWTDRWPKSVMLRWAGQGYRERLSPMAFLVALACLSRLGQNLCAHIALYYDADGTPFYASKFRDALPTLAGPVPHRTARKLACNALLQTSVLLPPDCFGEKPDEGPATRWSYAATRLIGEAFAVHEGATFDMLGKPTTPARAKFISDGLLAHPAVRPDQPVATFRGWGVKAHAMLGVLQIRSQVEQWCREHQDQGNADGGLSKSAGQGRPMATHQAAATLFYLWLETSHPRALNEEVKKVVTAFAPAKRKQIPAAVTIDDLARDERFGESLNKEMRVELAKLSGPGQMGYSAWYHPILSISDQGDDIAHYEALQIEALKEWKGAAHTGINLPDHDLSRIDPQLIQRLGLGKGMSAARKARKRTVQSTPLSPHPLAATYAQRSAMMVSGNALDLMHRQLRKDS